MTAIVAIVFILTSMTLSYFSGVQKPDLFDSPARPAATAPATGTTSPEAEKKQ
jgi:preprotein translocase subunit SecG